MENEALLYAQVRPELKFRAMKLDWELGLVAELKDLQLQLNRIDEVQCRRELAKSYNKDLRQKRELLSILMVNVEAEAGYGAKQTPLQPAPEITDIGGLALRDVEHPDLGYKSVGDRYEGFCLDIGCENVRFANGSPANFHRIIMPILDIKSFTISHPTIGAN